MTEQPEWMTPAEASARQQAETKRARSNAMTLFGILLLATGTVGLLNGGAPVPAILAALGLALLVAGLVTRP